MINKSKLLSELTKKKVCSYGNSLLNLFRFQLSLNQGPRKCRMEEPICGVLLLVSRNIWEIPFTHNNLLKMPTFLSISTFNFELSYIYSMCLFIFFFNSNPPTFSFQSHFFLVGYYYLTQIKLDRVLISN